MFRGRETRRRIRITLAAGAALLLTLFGSAGVVSAQETDESFDLGIVAVNCDIRPPQNITVAEEGCSPAEGVVFTATIENGDAVGSCTAQVAEVADPITAGCTIEIPYGSTVVVNEDPTTVPAGYAIAQNAQIFTAPDEPPTGAVGGVIFVNLLQDGDGDAPEPADDEPADESASTDEDPAVHADGLPRTGAGDERAPGNDSTVALAIAGAIASTAAAGALIPRLRES